MIYVQRRDKHGLETVDQFETMREAKAMIKEYRIADNYGYYYLSSRACKAWGAK
jgi:hypothetical protein